MRVLLSREEEEEELTTIGHIPNLHVTPEVDWLLEKESAFYKIIDVDMYQVEVVEIPRLQEIVRAHIAYDPICPYCMSGFSDALIGVENTEVVECPTCASLISVKRMIQVLFEEDMHDLLYLVEPRQQSRVLQMLGV